MMNSYSALKQINYDMNVKNRIKEGIPLLFKVKLLGENIFVKNAMSLRPLK